jgi:hypothetical protein
MREQSSISVPGTSASQPGNESNLTPGLPPGRGWPSAVQTVALLWFMVPGDLRSALVTRPPTR